MTTMMRIPNWLNPPQPEDNAGVAAFRAQAWQAFLQQGLPTRKLERFKYADFSFLNEYTFTRTHSDITEQCVAAFKKMQPAHAELLTFAMINGNYQADLSAISLLPKGVIVCSWNQALQQYQALIKPYLTTIATSHYPFELLNAAQFTNGLFIYIPANTHVQLPIHLLSLVTNDSQVIYPRHLVIVEKNSEVTVLEEYKSSTQQAYFMNASTTWALAENAKVDYYKLQNESQQAVHVANVFIQQAVDSEFNLTNISVGSQFARDDVLVQLNATGAKCQTLGFYKLGKENQYIDHHIDIEHNAAMTQSDMFYKGIIANKARAVFNGRVKVAAGAQKIIANQANHNLLLAANAEVYSKPELEIYADDVKCQHGATTGQIDEAEIFYLRSRGIPFEVAQAMLLAGFAEEVMTRIKHPFIKNYLQAKV